MSHKLQPASVFRTTSKQRLSLSARLLETGRWPMLLILGLAALLRAYNLSGQSLWADEGNSAVMARRTLVEIAQRTALDIHPPLYYWLLKGWTAMFGASEAGLRSLSVALGVGLVYLVGLLGWRFFSPRAGLIAAFITAIAPLQVYYAQEARMYMLLAFVTTLTALAALFYVRCQGWGTAQVVYVIAATAGLYTHYAYPLILVAINLSVPAGLRASGSLLRRWLLLQVIPLALYLPWLPVAWRQVTTWPSEREAMSLPETLGVISNTLLFGLSWPFEPGLFSGVFLGLVLLLTLWPGLNKKPPALILVWLWFLLPAALTAVIFSPAFLKFLLVAAPALALLLALAIERLALLALPGRPAWAGYLAGGGLLLAVAVASLVSLYHYYADPAYARDDYRSIAGFIKALSGPTDAVILHAEGQQDVFNYYFFEDGASSPLEAAVYPLPRRRPLDKAATVVELEQIARQAKNIYAVYWAGRQADPSGLIETWLDTHLYKAFDRWYGNVRLAAYASPPPGAPVLTPVDARLGQHIRLTGYGLHPDQPAPGGILQVTLAWTADAALAEDYTVFIQVLDGANHLVGQRDAPLLTAAPGQGIPDKHGVFIEPGTPPGRHRLIAGLYHAGTGQRLPVSAGNETSRADFIDLGEIEIVRPAEPLPPEAFNIQTRLSVPLQEVTLLGYDLYKPGYRSEPDTPLRPGDPVHLVAYWLVREQVRSLQNELVLQVVTRNGQATPAAITAPPAGTDYPITSWQPGEIVRAQYDLFLTDLAPGPYRLALTLKKKETGSLPATAMTGPFKVVD